VSRSFWNRGKAPHRKSRLPICIRKDLVADVNVCLRSSTERCRIPCLN